MTVVGGLPIGATLVTERVNAAINYGDHGRTFAGWPLVYVAAITVFHKISNSTRRQCGRMMPKRMEGTRASWLVSPRKLHGFNTHILLRHSGGDIHEVPGALRNKLKHSKTSTAHGGTEVASARVVPDPQLPKLC